MRQTNGATTIRLYEKMSAENVDLVEQLPAMRAKPMQMMTHAVRMMTMLMR